MPRKPAPPVPAPLSVTASETSKLESYQPFQSGAFTPDSLLAWLHAEHPKLRELLETRDPVRRATVLRDIRDRRLDFMLLTVSFQFAKRGRHDDAIALNRLRLEMVKLVPEDSLDGFDEHTVARNRGDILAMMAGQLHDSGELGAALAAGLEAEQWFDRDAALRKRAGVPDNINHDSIFHEEDFRSQNLSSIARIYSSLNDPRKAGEYHALAWKHSRHAATPHGRFEVCMDHARGAREAGNLNAALGLYWDALDQALTSSSSTISGQDVVRGLVELAAIYRDLRLYRRALELYRRSLAINEGGGHEGRQQKDLRNIAEIQALQGDVSNAVETFHRSLRLCSLVVQGPQAAALSWNDGGTDRQIVRLEPATRVLLALARLVWATDLPAADRYLALAVQVVERLRGRVFSDEARVKYQETATAIFDEAIDLLFARYQAERSPELLDRLFDVIERGKSRVLLEMIADQPVAASDLSPELLKAEADLLQHERKIEEQLQSASTTAQQAVDLNEVQRELEAVWQRMESQGIWGAEYVALRRARPITPSDLRAMLRHEQSPVAVVNYYATPRRLIAVAVGSDRPDLRVAHADVSRADLRAAVLLNSADPPSLDLRLPYWQLDLPPLTIDPIRPLVEGYGHVVLVPHDVLHGVPLHALASEGTQPLLANRSVSFSPSASVLRFCLRGGSSAEGPSLVLGAPARDDEESLPHAALEATRIAAVLGCAPRLGRDATREIVLREAPVAKYIHVACHNRFDAADPLSSALKLSDGDLSARDILGMSLSPDLVVLSACQSAVSQTLPGDEIMGIVRALLFAGAPSIVVSLWNAYDDPTTRLMVDFYERRARGEGSKVAALCHAQRKRYEEGARTWEWAPFILIGDWRGTETRSKGE